MSTQKNDEPLEFVIRNAISEGVRLNPRWLAPPEHSKKLQAICDKSLESIKSYSNKEALKEALEARIDELRMLTDWNVSDYGLRGRHKRSYDDRIEVLSNELKGMK